MEADSRKESYEYIDLTSVDICLHRIVETTSVNKRPFAELEARKAQYTHYRNQLLSCESLEETVGSEVVATSIETICRHICSGGTPSTKRSDFYDDGDIPWVRTQDINYCTINDASAYITKEGLESSAAKWIPASCVIVAMYGAGATREFVARSFAEGEVAETGTEITRLMTRKLSRFAPSNAYAEMKARVVEKLKAFFERFSNMGPE